LLKKAFTYLLLVFMICQSVKIDFFEQLQKIPQLILHYKHHVYDEQERINFAEFIVLHYNQHSKHKNEEDHNQLPLFDSCFKHCIYFFAGINANIAGLAYNIIVKINYPYTFCYSYINVKGIFQPPRCRV